MRKILLVMTASLLIISCNGQVIEERSNSKYKSAKKGFASELTSHFPDMLTTQPNTFVDSKNLSKNDVCFMLYEYNVDIEKIDSIINKIKNNQIAKYSSNDSCLIVINRFETVDTHQNRKDVKVTDSTKINRDCYQGLYPIPNFIDYRNVSSINDIKLDKDFDIYVFEAKSANNFKEFDLPPNFQMPDEWKNGYSKGIAISKEKKTVIYWSVIW